MGEFKTMKYVYDDVEEALKMNSAFTELFMKEKIYESHEMRSLTGGRFLLKFKVKNNGTEDKG